MGINLIGERSMEKGTKISVIIPVYAVENYLPECIESVMSQSYKQTEIILVDDGSPDKSPEICDNYALKYPNIRVIHKVNGGLSDARNSGIEQATGDYIAFLDGDDFWDNSDALLELVKRLEVTKAEVLNFSFKKYFEDTQEKIPYFFEVPEMPVELTDKKSQLKYLADNHLYISSACNKLIKKELFSEALKFEKGVYSEDVEWSACLLKEAKTMDFICSNFYCYRQRRDSISHTINDKKSNDLCNHIINCVKMAQIANGEEKTILSVYAAYQFGTYFIVQAQAENPQYNCINRLNEYRGILAYHQRNKKLLVLHIACKIFGYKNVCKIVRFAYRKQR